jgi:uncharacterized membrane protein YqgA involved in biofilm formation
MPHALLAMVNKLKRGARSFMLNGGLTAILCVAGLFWAASISSRVWMTLIIAIVGMVVAFFTVPFLFYALGFSASSMTLHWRILKAILALFGGDLVEARRFEMIGNYQAAIADMWTIPSLVFAPLFGLIHAMRTKRLKSQQNLSNAETQNAKAEGA